MNVNNLNNINSIQSQSSSQTQKNSSTGAEKNLPFGSAVVRGSTRPREDSSLYGRDATLNAASQQEESEELRTLNALKARDQEVRQKADTQQAAGGTHFIYQQGPDGEQYVIGSVAKVAKKLDQGGTDLPNGVAGEENTNEAGPSGELSSHDEALLKKLEQRDDHVRAHESAHVMAAGSQVRGMPEYTYQTGPDGKQYAIGGSVNICVTTDPNNPEKTAREAETASRAALAPGDPSGQDLAMLAQNNNIAMKARQKAANAYADSGAYL